MTRVSGTDGPVDHAGFGAVTAGGMTTFRVWAPANKQVTLALARAAGPDDERPLASLGAGVFGGSFADVPAGSLYR
jgi:1,4-alpha-glucan branching enzyme